MPSNQTPNYALNQWSKEDRVLMDDFNADNAKIDGALAAQAGTLAAHGEALSKLGSCRVHITSYMGTGVNNYNEHGLVPLDDCPHIVLPGVPKVLLVIGGGIMYHLPETGNMAYILNTGRSGFFGVKWEGSTAIIQLANSNESSYMNQKAMYYALAFYPAE